MIKKIYSAGISIILSWVTFGAVPDEGMWIPMLIGKYNIKIMQEKGFRLSAEDIYSVNRACMKDAVVLFGRGCTGEVISSEGLLMTNHHCAYSRIQGLSTVGNDYLTNGFWAMSRGEELPCPGLSVRFLKSMEDVTERMFSGISEGMDYSEREKIFAANSDGIMKNAVENTGYSASIRPFYMGNQYFLFVYEIFTDIRFVGAPPSAIGKFGGETDNWIWPRHTGDFSLFRIYAGKDNKPARFSKENVPYKPLHHFPVSLKGVREGDFTMIMGYPGATNEYVPSYFIDMMKNHINPKMIGIRTKKVEIIESAMKNDPHIRLQYSGKLSGIANSWKRWIGETYGLEKLKTLEKKLEYENRLTAWINEDGKRKEKYGNILPAYKELYDELKELKLADSYTNEAFFSSGIEAVGFSRNMVPLESLFVNEPDTGKINSMKDGLISMTKGFFRNYDLETDKKLFVAIMTMYGENLGPDFLASEYLQLKRSCNGNFQSLADMIYDRSLFTNEARLTAFINEFTGSSKSRLLKDPFYTLARGISIFLNENVLPEMDRINSEIAKLDAEYMKLQIEFDDGHILYPDGNSTLRISYGNVRGYEPKDGIYYRYFTTLKGIIEKNDPNDYYFDVPDKLKKLYIEKDYGRYAQDGELPVCFIADNHTTGGSSGSPVINADGHLIGINFDRAWEGIASDMEFNPEQSRNISLDIRYALFIIDKFAGAGYLLEEMTIIE